MASIRFGVKKQGNSLVIRAFFQNGDDEPAKNIGYTIPAYKAKDEYKHWDKKNYRVRGGIDNQFEINEKISSWENRFARYLKQCSDNAKPVDVYAFRTSLDFDELPVVEHTDNPRLLDIANDFYNEKKITTTQGTHKQYATMIDNIKGFEAYIGRKLYVSDVDHNFYKDYGYYLIEKEDNYNNTINRKIGRILTLLNNTKGIHHTPSLFRMFRKGIRN